MEVGGGGWRKVEVDEGGWWYVELVGGAGGWTGSVSLLNGGEVEIND